MVLLDVGVQFAERGPRGGRAQGVKTAALHHKRVHYAGMFSSREMDRDRVRTILAHVQSLLAAVLLSSSATALTAHAAAGPALQAIASKATDPKEQGALMGSLQSLQSLSIVIAPLISTQLLATVSLYPQGDWRMGVVFYLSAILQFIGVVLAWRFFSKNGVPIHPANKSPSPLVPKSAVVGD